MTCGAGRHWESPANHDWFWIPKTDHTDWEQEKEDLQVMLFAGFKELGVHLAHRKKVNLVKLAEHFGISKSKIYRWKKAWEKTAVQWKEEEVLNAQIAADIREIKEDVRVIREYFPTPTEVAESALRREALEDVDKFADDPRG